MSITKSDILKEAKAKALSYLKTAKKKKPLTPKEKEALAIYELAKDVQGCQEEPLLKLLDRITKLPISKAKILVGSLEFEMCPDWGKDNPLRVFVGRKVYISLGVGNDVLTRRGIVTNISVGCGFTYATKEEIEVFFNDLPAESIGHLVTS